MERADARETEWIDLEVAVNQAFVEAEQGFLDAAARQAADADDARSTAEHLEKLASLRKRIEDQVARAKAREEAASDGEPRAQRSCAPGIPSAFLNGDGE